MTDRQKQLAAQVDAVASGILEAEKWLWAHPQTGFTEWDANAYLTEHFESLGYTLHPAGNIPGFITDLDTGLPGPTVCVMAELDALDIANHPESVNGMAHSCGHHAQCAALLGVAAALKQPGALDGLCGKIRLMAVPAEEMIQLGFRENLRKQGIIRYMGGKTEFMHRGFFDGVDISMIVHGTSNEEKDFIGRLGHNGCIAKTIRYKGKAAHAGGYPHLGVNAQYAASLGLHACNALRETFREEDYIRFHPIMMGANCAVNIIPDEICMETFVRGRTIEAIKHENLKLNRALAGSALAMGAGVEIIDRPGYFPEVSCIPFMKLIEQCCADLCGADRVNFDYQSWSAGSSDFGDLTAVMPGVQFYACGVVGTSHGTDYKVADPNRLCVNSAKAQLFVLDALLSQNAAAAQKIIDDFEPKYPSIQAYLEDVDSLILDKDAVVYDEHGNAVVDYQNS